MIDVDRDDGIPDNVVLIRKGKDTISVLLCKTIPQAHSIIRNRGWDVCSCTLLSKGLPEATIRVIYPEEGAV